MRKSIDFEHDLNELHAKQRVLAKKIQLRLSTLAEFDKIQEQNRLKKIQYLTNEFELSRRRNFNLLQEINLQLLVSKNNLSSQSSTELSEAKLTYQLSVEAQLPAWKRQQLTKEEEKILKLAKLKDDSMKRRQLLHVELEKEEKLRTEVETKRRELVLEETQEHIDQLFFQSRARQLRQQGHVYDEALLSELNQFHENLKSTTSSSPLTSEQDAAHKDLFSILQPHITSQSLPLDSLPPPQSLSSLYQQRRDAPPPPPPTSTSSPPLPSSFPDLSDSLSRHSSSPRTSLPPSKTQPTLSPLLLPPPPPLPPSIIDAILESRGEKEEEGIFEPLPRELNLKDREVQHPHPLITSVPPPSPSIPLPSSTLHPNTTPYSPVPVPMLTVLASTATLQSSIFDLSSSRTFETPEKPIPSHPLPHTPIPSPNLHATSSLPLSPPLENPSHLQPLSSPPPSPKAIPTTTPPTNTPPTNTPPTTTPPTNTPPTTTPPTTTPPTTTPPTNTPPTNTPPTNTPPTNTPPTNQSTFGGDQRNELEESEEKSQKEIEIERHPPERVFSLSVPILQYFPFLNCLLRAHETLISFPPSPSPFSSQSTFIDIPTSNRSSNNLRNLQLKDIYPPSSSSPSPSLLAQMQSLSTSLIAHLSTREETRDIEGKGEVDLSSFSCEARAALILRVVSDLSTTLVPRDVFLGVVSADRLRREHRAEGQGVSEVWGEVVAHLRRLVDIKYALLDGLCSVFTDALVSTSPPSDKARLQRKVTSLLKSFILEDGKDSKERLPSPSARKPTLSLPLSSPKTDLPRFGGGFVSGSQDIGSESFSVIAHDSLHDISGIEPPNTSILPVTPVTTTKPVKTLPPPKIQSKAIASTKKKLSLSYASLGLSLSHASRFEEEELADDEEEEDYRKYISRPIRDLSMSTSLPSSNPQQRKNKSTEDDEQFF